MKYGRLPRAFSPEVPHLSAVKMMKTLVRPQLPFELHNQASLPKSLGVMNNDRLGCCTCSAMGHAEQLWTALAQPPMITVPDSCVLDAYEQACGYDPSQTARDGTNPTDAGGVEQNVLSWWMNTGLLQADGTRRQIEGFVEIDPRNPYDLCEAIYECGLIYIGFSVPRLLPEDPAGALWTGTRDLGGIEGGHAVILTGYRDVSNPVFDVESWGMPFVMDWPFFMRYVDEAYAPFSKLWIEQSGKSPWGIDLPTIEGLMQALRRQ